VGETRDVREERERSFHNVAFAEHTRQAADKYYCVAHESDDYYRRILTADCAGKRALEVGCGSEGYSSRMLVAAGATVTGIDISDFAVTECSRKVAGTFLRMSAESTSFPAASFDIICGNGILHHLDLQRAFREIARLLAPGGKAVFLEPLGHNPLINLYRRLTPSMRTSDEHPLLMGDLRAAERHFGDVSLGFFHCLALAATPFRDTRAFPLVSRVSGAVDRLVLRGPFRRFAWICVLTMRAPEPGRDAR
jgi:SAM-dependent methyltransferase